MPALKAVSCCHNVHC